MAKYSFTRRTGSVVDFSLKKSAIIKILHIVLPITAWGEYIKLKYWYISLYNFHPDMHICYETIVVILATYR